MRENVKESIVRVFILLVGLVIAHFGVTLFILADLGSDPFNVFIQGLFRKEEILLAFSFISHGRVHVVVSVLIIIILLIIDRKYIKAGTILCMIFGGPIIDAFTGLLSPVFQNDLSLILRLLTNCVGCIVLAYGMTIVIKSEAGTGPNDLVAVVISDKLSKSFGIVRIIVDICFAGIGYALGGTIGIGTVICAVIVGPVAGIFLEVNEKIINNIVNRI